MLKPCIYACLIAVVALSFTGLLSGPDSHMKRMHKLIDRYHNGQAVTWSPLQGDAWLLTDETGQALGRIDYREVASCAFGGCATTVGMSLASADMIHYMVLRDAEGARVEQVYVLAYESSYGFQIVSRSWLNQFNGLLPGEVEIDDQVDGISGATVSVQALIQDINQLPIVQ
ncbi:MAG: FMN-binding protein [Flavobacteriales bacterium]|jgi:hypothetical protein|nr:FMN-binding protein [Flavobacteriales bacterium]